MTDITSSSLGCSKYDFVRGYNLFTLLDLDTDSDFNYKPKGYILLCRTFHTVQSATHISILTANWRNRIGILIRIGFQIRESQGVKQMKHSGITLWIKYTSRLKHMNTAIHAESSVVLCYLFFFFTLSPSFYFVEENRLHPRL